MYVGVPTDRGAPPPWEPMGNFFGIFFTPVVYIQNDQGGSPPAADHQYISWEPDFMGNFFGIFFTPVVYIQNDQRVMGIILRYVCWGTHRPPPPPPGSPAADHQYISWEPDFMGNFLEFFLHQLCIFKMISVSWGSF